MSALRNKKVQIPIFAIVGVIVVYDLFVMFGDRSEGAPAPEKAERVEVMAEPSPDRAAPEEPRTPAAILREHFSGRNPFFFSEELERGKPITLLLEEKARHEREQRAAADRRMREDVERDVFVRRLLEAELRGIVVAPAGRSRVWIDGRILAEGDSLLSPEITLASIQAGRALFRVGERVYAKELTPPPPETEEGKEQGQDGESTETSPGEEGGLVPVEPSAAVGRGASLVPALQEKPAPKSAVPAPAAAKPAPGASGKGS